MNKALKNNALKQIVNFYQINENIGTSGQPEAEQFKIIHAEGFEVVVNLALYDSPNAIEDENSIIRKLDMIYVHIPVDFKSPALEDLDSFFKCMEKHKNKNIFVHCVMNWRVSAFMFLYHTVKCQMPITEARRHMHTVWQPEPMWQEFIDDTLNTYGINPD